VTLQFILAAVVSLLGQTTPVAGSISGVVVNASRELAPVGGAEVVLRVELEGQFVIAAEGIADEQGRFVFDNIPADAEYIYLPGANRGGVHYPASRVRLSAQRPHARVKLAIHDTVSDPNPLVLRRHDITIHPETDALRVTEKLLIENPSSKTYVGHPAGGGGRATTLRLSIPTDFRRTTFQKEFYGRQFTLFDSRLVTDIPWTPGQRELAFTYVLPNEDRNRVWQRPLDLPCDHLRIEVHTDTPDEISCNLSRASSQTKGAVTFESKGQTLPADHMVRVQLESLPISLATYGRWLALSVLVGLIVATVLIRTPKSPSQLSDRQPAIAQKQAA
jgi:hypothetical protein